MRKYEKAITLVALVVSIIILIILAGVSINLILGNNGIVTKSIEAKKVYQNATDKEEIELGAMENEISSYIVGQRDSSEPYQLIGTYDVGMSLDLSKLSFHEIWIEVYDSELDIMISSGIIKEQLTNQDKKSYFGYSTILGVEDGMKAKLVMNSNSLKIEGVWSTNASNESTDIAGRSSVTYYCR